MAHGLRFGDDNGIECNFNVSVNKSGIEETVLSFRTYLNADLNFTVGTVGIAINMYPLVSNFSV